MGRGRRSRRAPVLDLLSLVRRSVIASEAQRSAALSILQLADDEAIRLCARRNSLAVALLRTAKHLGSMEPTVEQLSSRYTDDSVQAMASRINELLPALDPTWKQNRAVADGLVVEELLRVRAPDELRRFFTSSIFRPRPMPLVEGVLEDHKAVDDCSDVVVLACQHLMGTVVSQMTSLVDHLEIPTRQVVMTGKPYSTSPIVTEVGRAIGFNVDQGGLDYPREAVTSRKQYDSWMRSHLRSLAEEALEISLDTGKEPRVLVIDDGGLLISEVAEILQHDLRFIDVRVVGVEQTRGGVIRASEGWMDVRFPVVNVAESAPKLVAESPMIAASVVDSLWSRLEFAHGIDSPEDLAVVVVGYGSVGSWVVRELRSRRVKSLVVHDSDPAKLSIAAAHGCRVDAEEESALRRADVVIACTGHSSLSPAGARALPAEALLASAGSSNREFGAVLSPQMEPYRMPFGVTSHEDSPFGYLHSDFRIATEWGERSVLNGGFPVNFDGSIDPIRARSIQLTRALMVAGCLQALSPGMYSPKQPGVELLDLDTGLAAEIDRRFRRVSQG